MLSTGIRTPGRRQGARHRSRRDGEAGAPDRGGHSHRAGHDQRLCRAGDRRLLHEHRSRPRAARPLRTDGGRPAGAGRHGARRRAGDHHGRRPRALYRQHPLSARLSQRSAGDRDPGADPVGGWRHRAARPGRQGESRAGAGQHPHRERAACRLYLRRFPRPRRRRLRRRRPEGGHEPDPVPAGLLTSPGAGSSSISSAPRPACRSWCRSRC